MTRRLHPIWLGVASTLVAVGLAWLVWRATRPSTPYQTVRLDPGTEPEDVVPGREPYVSDPLVGFRPPRSTTFDIRIAALDSAELVDVVRRSNNLGFVREDDLQGELTGPRVLVVGDSHILGVVDTRANVGPVLESMLRARPGLEQALVLNAACGYYSLYQYVLRVRSLSAKVRPDVVVVVVFTGNDFLDLENRGVPHLDDDLVERPAASRPPPERTRARREALELPTGGAPGYLAESAFWQGLNQAAWLHREPDRLAVLHAKIAHCVRLMRAAADEHAFELVWVLLPPADLVFPDKVRDLGPAVAAVLDSGQQRALHEWFAALLAERGAESIDLLGPFVADGRLDLYAVDFHIFVRGHRLLAESVFPAVVEACAR